MTSTSAASSLSILPSDWPTANEWPVYPESRFSDDAFRDPRKQPIVLFVRPPVQKVSIPVFKTRARLQDEWEEAQIAKAHHAQKMSYCMMPGARDAEIMTPENPVPKEADLEPESVVSKSRNAVKVKYAEVKSMIAAKMISGMQTVLEMFAEILYCFYLSIVISTLAAGGGLIAWTFFRCVFGPVVGPFALVIVVGFISALRYRLWEVPQEHYSNCAG